MNEFWQKKKLIHMSDSNWSRPYWILHRHHSKTIIYCHRKSSLQPRLIAKGWMEVLIPTQLKLLAPTKSMGHKAPYTHPTCEQIETLGFSDAKVVPRMWVRPFLYKSSRFSWSAQHFHGLDTISSLMNNYIHDTPEVGYQLFRPHNPISWEIV